MKHIQNHITAVSIQLISPASGEANRGTRRRTQRLVSIQLISPASGEGADMCVDEVDARDMSFHSINFPSEWGVEHLDPPRVGQAAHGFPFN